MKYFLVLAALVLFGAGCANGSSTKPVNAPVPNSGVEAQSTSQAPAPREVEIRIDSTSGDFKIEPIE